MTDLYICIDTGGSQTKIIYQVAQASAPSYMLMPPHVEEVTEATILRYLGTRGLMGTPTPEQQAWIVVGKQAFVVGEFAEEFNTVDRLHELKYENALYKTLGAIGVIAETIGLPTTQPLNVKLAILLPWNEFSDRLRFEAALEVRLKSFQFRQKNIQVNLEQVICRPEGGGLAMTWFKKKTSEYFRNRKIAVIMFGHRNTSALLFDNGVMKIGDSPLYGFSVLLDQVLSMKSGLYRDKLAAAIFTGIRAAEKEIHSDSYTYTRHPEWKNLNAIRSLATAKNPGLREAEIADIVNAIIVATNNYWDKIKGWLDRVLPTDLNEVLISGGAALFLEPELEAYFNCQRGREFDAYKGVRKYERRIPASDWTDIIWGANLEEEIHKAFNFQHKQPPAFYQRLVDAFGLFDYLLAKAEEAKQQAAAEAQARKKAQDAAKKEEAKRKAVDKKTQVKQVSAKTPQAVSNQPRERVELKENPNGENKKAQEP